MYFSSASMYLSVMNFLLILATFKKSYGIEISAYVAVPLGFLLVICIGWLDYRFIKKHETAHVNRMSDVKEQLDRIEERLKEGKL